MQRRVRSTVGWVTALAMCVLLAACGGGDDAEEPGFADLVDQTGDPSSSIDDSAEDPADGPSGDSNAAGPVNGLVTSQPTFGLGLYVVDRQSGEGRELQAADIEFVDRQNEPIIAGDAAFTLGFTVREGQSFANDVDLTRIDLATGAVTSLVALGFDRETDDSQELISFRVLAASPDEVLVRRTTFGGDDAVLTRYDAATGAELGSLPPPTYEFEYGNGGRCSGGVTDLTYLSDGRLAGRANGAPGYVDPSTGAVELAVSCEDDVPDYDDLIAPADFASYAVFRATDQLSDEELASLFDTELSPHRNFVEGDGALWWLSLTSRSVGDTISIIGAIVRFDLATNSITDAWPLGEHAGEFVDCLDDGSTCELTLVQGQLRYLDGRLVIVDTRENAPVLIFDPASGTLTELVIEPGEGIDFTTADLRAADPDGVWIDVRRMVITSDPEDSGRSASGRSFLERIDPVAGEIAVSVPVEDLTGF